MSLASGSVGLVRIVAALYRIARRSATETAAILHIMARRGHVHADCAQQARDLLARIVSMLVRMTKD